MIDQRTDALPPEVLEALVELETAQSPAGLGGAYQVLLDWRHRRPLAVFLWNAAPAFATLAGLGAAYLALRYLDFPNTEFWRGVDYGLMIAVVIIIVRDWFWPPRLPPASLGARIEAAIDRWRHAVPAMRELPK